MKIKNILSIIILIGFMSCSKEFTDLSPISERNTGSFFTTANDMEVAVTGVYNSLLSQGVYNEAIWIMNDLRSDNSFWTGGGLAEAIIRYDDFEETTTDYVGRDAWIAHYEGIGRANIVLDKIEDIEMDTSQKNRLIGETLFLRSLLYYNLATTFGNVPLILEATKSVSDGDDHAQVPATQVYNQIVTDLTDAESKLPSTASKGGRATSGAAAALLGKVYLTIGDKSNAASALKRVSGYSLVDNYADLWGVANEFNKESIFEVSYESGYGSLGNLFTSALNAELAITVTSGSRNWPDPSLVAAYEEGDTRKDATIKGLGDEGIDWAGGNGYCIKYGTTNPSTDNDGPNNWVVLRYADVLLMLAEAIGESDESYGYINQVRARAGLGPISASTPGTFSEKLLHERKVELAYEGHRWPDLKRFGVAASVMSSIGVDIKGRLNLAIPQREMDINSSFTQNPGY